MKDRFFTILALVVFVGCGSPEPSTTETAEATPSPTGTPGAASAEQSESDDGPCSVLDVDWIRYDTSGKPMAYSFEYPSGWDINELFISGTSSVDITRNLDDQPIPEFVLRFGHVVDKQLDKPENLVATWRKMPMMEEILEIDVEGRTMYVAKTKMGELISFQALFPDVTSDAKAWMVTGGVASAPRGCRDEAVAAVERVIRSFAPNRDIGPPPVQ